MNTFRVAYGYSDGACCSPALKRADAGLAGIGGVLFDADGVPLQEIATGIGKATVNVAEYRACLAVIIAAQRLAIDTLHLYSDSQIIVYQITGAYSVLKAHLITLHHDVVARLQTFTDWSITWIPREQNAYADQLSKIGLELARYDYLGRTSG